MSDEENANVRVWTELLARIRFGTQEVAGKKVRGATVKAVGYRLANYADSDGSRIHPGLARLAVDLEIDHGTAKRCVQALVRCGLLRLVKPGARPGHADEYRLTIPADLLERDDIEVWSPARQRLEIERVRERTRGRHTRRDLRVPTAPADGDSCGSLWDPQESDRQVPQGPADGPGSDLPAGPVGTDIGRPAGPVGTDLQVPQGPATYQRPGHIYDPPRDTYLRTAVTVSRAREAVGDQIPDDENDQPSGCLIHGRAFAAGTRPDGKPACPLCRVAARAAPPDSPPDRLAPVIPLRSVS